MRPLPRILFRSFTQCVAVYQRVFMDVRILGRENIPRGPKIFAVNHVTSTDMYWILPVFRDPVHLVLGPSYQFRFLRFVLDRMEMLCALPGETKTMIESAVRYLRQGESVVIAPEGDIQEPFRIGPLQPGVAAMYRRARVPIVPMVLAAPKWNMLELPLRHEINGRVFRTRAVLRGPYGVKFGEPFAPRLEESGRRDEYESILTTLRERLQSLVDDDCFRGLRDHHNPQRAR